MGRDFLSLELSMAFPLVPCTHKVMAFAHRQAFTQRKPSRETSDSPKTTCAAFRKLNMAHTWLE